MKCIELNPKGNFEAWEKERKKELNSLEISDALGHKIMFEDGKIRIWHIQLAPKERLGFRTLNRDFQVMSQVRGFAVSRRQCGAIYLIQYNNGDIYHHNHEDHGEQVWDLENIGADKLEFVVMEELTPENSISAN